jgi:hypothetical protein
MNGCGCLPFLWPISCLHTGFFPSRVFRREKAVLALSLGAIVFPSGMPQRTRDGTYGRQGLRNVPRFRDGDPGCVTRYSEVVPNGLSADESPDPRCPAINGVMASNPLAPDKSTLGLLVTDCSLIEVWSPLKVQSCHFAGRSFPRRNPEGSTEPESAGSSRAPLTVEWLTKVTGRVSHSGPKGSFQQNRY